TAGLALAPTAMADPSARALGVVPIAVISLASMRPREDGRLRWAWLALLVLVGGLAGLLAGGARLHSIDAGALRARPGGRAGVEGFVAGVPRRPGGGVSVRVASPAGRVLLVSTGRVPDLRIGSEVGADGVLATPEPWRAGYLRRLGVAMILRTDRIEPKPPRPGGVPGWSRRGPRASPA